MIPQQAPCVYNPRKLQPRGGAEREDFTHLREFLDAYRAKPEDETTTYEPRSQFEWEDDDDEEDSGFKVSGRRLKKQRPAAAAGKQKALGKAKGNDNGNGVGDKDATQALLGTLDTSESIGGSLESKQEFLGSRFSGCSEVGAEVGGGADHVTLTEQHVPHLGEKKAPERKPSVLKIFNDPVWHHDNGESGLAPNLKNGVADADCTATDVKTEDGSDGNTVESGSEANTTAPQPSVSIATAWGDVGPDAFSSTAMSPNGFRQVNWALHDRGMSAIVDPGCAPGPAPPSRFSGFESYMPQPQPAEKPSILKKFKSQFSMYSAPLTVTEDDPHRYDYLMAGLIESDGFYIPKFVSRLRRGTSSSDLNRASSADPFVGGSSQVAASKTKHVSSVINSGDNTRRFNDYLNSPSRHDKRGKDIASNVGPPVLPQLAKVAADGRSPVSLLAPSTPSSTTARTSPGLPKGPWEPDWDDAVKYVKKLEKEREAREAKEAKVLKIELKKEEKRVKKLKAGKDVVKRGSQLGLTPKKPVQDMTEDEFELVGSAATTPQKETTIAKKSGVLGAFFTKMRGTKQEQEMQAEDIDRKLENHSSLLMLKLAGSKNINEPTPEDRGHYDKALRVLNGEQYEEENLVSPFESSPDSDANAASAPVGLGISAESQEHLANHNKAAAEMGYEEFAASRQKTNDFPAANNEGNHTGLEPIEIVGDATEETYALRPMSTIEEAEGEEAEMPKVNRAGGIHDRQPEDQSFSSSSSLYSTEDVEEARMFDGLSGPYQSSKKRFRSEVDHYVDINTLAYSLDSDAIPAPLSVQKTRKGKEVAQTGYGEVETPTKLPPLKIPVIHVSTSSQDMRPAESNSFTPKKTNSYYSRIQEASRLQQSKVGSHPAFRDLNDGTDTVAKAAEDVSSQIRPRPTSEHARVDSGIGMGVDVIVDEGYATGTTKQQEFIPPQSPQNPGSELAVNGKSQQPRKPTLSGKTYDDGQAVRNVDIQALRNEVGVAAIRLPSGPESPKHPNHPFTWNHEKVMCREIHNPLNVQPQLPPEMPHNHPLHLSRMDSQYFNSSPTKSQMTEAKMCDNCGKFCCRFANLVITSKIATSKDLAEEMVRLKAEQRVNMLRAFHPSGIEEYDTFLNCAQCGHHVCPGCATKCTEYLCQAIVCADCTDETQVCPVHNFI